MLVELLHNTPLWVCARAIRKCWASEAKSDNGDVKDLELIDRIGNKYKHASTLEHLVYTFEIKGVSRALLQELARHRIASYSVKSTRYTLKELKEEEAFVLYRGSLYEPFYRVYDFERAKRYVVLTESEGTNECIIEGLDNLRAELESGTANDIAKYCLPEAYKTKLCLTINARSLQNFLELRTSKSALWEIQSLAKAIFDALPEDHKYLFLDSVGDES